jgi:hypothetical protein
MSWRIAFRQHWKRLLRKDKKKDIDILNDLFD